MATYYIACGGTGGHFFPGVALAEKLKERGHTVCLYISKKEIDAKMAAAYPEFHSTTLDVIGWQGFSKIISFTSKFFRSYRFCKKELIQSKPKAVIGMGGFISAPPLLAARSIGLFTALHESNAIPGRVTRKLAGKVARVYLGFKKCASYLPNASTRFVGTPLRPHLNRVERAQAATSLGLNSQLKTITVMGGSQGAEGLNHLTCEALKQIAPDYKNEWQIIHLTGSRDEEKVRACYESCGFQAKVMAFSDAMAEIYSLSDFIISRSGASSLNEISFYRLPSILIPYPVAADDHQRVNASFFLEEGASFLLDEKKTSSHELASKIATLMKEEPFRQSMGQKAGRLFVSNATDQIVEELEHAA